MTSFTRLTKLPPFCIINLLPFLSASDIINLAYAYEEIRDLCVTEYRLKRSNEVIYFPGRNFRLSKIKRKTFLTFLLRTFGRWIKRLDVQLNQDLFKEEKEETFYIRLMVRYLENLETVTLFNFTLTEMNLTHWIELFNQVKNIRFYRCKFCIEITEVLELCPLIEIFVLELCETGDYCISNAHGLETRPLKHLKNIHFRYNSCNLNTDHITRKINLIMPNLELIEIYDYISQAHLGTSHQFRGLSSLTTIRIDLHAQPINPILEALNKQKIEELTILGGYADSHTVNLLSHFSILKTLQLSNIVSFPTNHVNALVTQNRPHLEKFRLHYMSVNIPEYFIYFLVKNSPKLKICQIEMGFGTKLSLEEYLDILDLLKKRNTTLKIRLTNIHKMLPIDESLLTNNDDIFHVEESVQYFFTKFESDLVNYNFF